MHPISNLDRDHILSNYEKYTLLSQMKSISGYGGLIHNFKNYLLRIDNKYKIQFESNYKKLLNYIARYNELPKNEREKELLYEIQKTFTLYKQNIDKISLYHSQNSDIHSIDELIPTFNS